MLVLVLLTFAFNTKILLVSYIFVNKLISPIRKEDASIFPSNFILPIICNFCCGLFVPIPTYPELVKLITLLITLLEPLCILNIEFEFDIRQSVFDVEEEKMSLLPLINSIFAEALLDKRSSCNLIATLSCTK